MPRPDEIDNPNFPTTHKQISWTAIIAGALVALSLSFLVHSLNAGIGLSAFNTSSSGMLALAIGAMLWYIITAIITMFIAGWVAGNLASHFSSNPFSGILHGFLAWSLALVVGLAITANIISGVVSSSEQAGYATAHLTRQAASESDKALTPSKKTENVANTAGATAIATFFIFLFGAVAAGAGGYYGINKKDWRFNTPTYRNHP